MNRSLLYGVVLVMSLAHGAIAAEVDHRAITIMSEGIPLAGDLWWPKEASVPVPGLLMVHGWGGEKSHLNQAYAPQFAALGIMVLTFDYRGWGESPGIAVRVPREEGKTLEYREVRELVLPHHFLEDIRNAFAYLVGEPDIDRSRLGVWGSSLGGGLALHTAIEFPEIRVLIAQVGNVNPRAGVEELPPPNPLSRESVFTRRIQMARGERPPFPGAESALPGLRGTMDWASFRRWDPFDGLATLGAATLIIDAASENLFDTSRNGKMLYDAIKGRVPARYEALPGDHYAIYSGPSYARAIELETEWLRTHLIGNAK